MADDLIRLLEGHDAVAGVPALGLIARRLSRWRANCLPFTHGAKLWEVAERIQQYGSVLGCRIHVESSTGGSPSLRSDWAFSLL
jgi:hypothetical protein